ncbi:hypothetical protein [Amycolatopsis plumensis]|uniref:Uncharacterized protein n=1 Tax=Amycolatopsis plumensis TaxID=236508 RepID=A0ABV5U952_9PSEU
MTTAHEALRLALGEIEPNDTNYPVRYVRVFQAVAMALHRNGGQHPDRLAQLMRDVDSTRRPGPLARAIGWFRR